MKKKTKRTFKGLLGLGQRKLGGMGQLGPTQSILLLFVAFAGVAYLATADDA